MVTETRYTTGTIWDEKDTQAFRDWLNGVLHNDIATVVFTKTDGTERSMRCTLNPYLMPEEFPKVPELTEDGKPVVTEAKVRKHNPDIRTAYDLDAKAWRSFRWTSIKSVTFDKK